MRYTTIIDIREQRAVYHNKNCRLLYLHLVLASGYHDDDRDIVEISIRNIASASGLTVSATRHALRILEAYGLVARNGNVWTVKKWVVEKTITPRPRNQREQKQREQANDRRARDDARERERELERERAQRLRSEGKTPFMVYYEGLLKEAAEGDVDAQKTVERHRATYEQQKAQMEAELAETKKKQNH